MKFNLKESIKKIPFNKLNPKYLSEIKITKIMLINALVVITAIAAIALLVMLYKLNSSNQKWSFGPNVDTSAVDKSEKRRLQKLINDMGEPVNGVSFTGYHAYYTEDGGLIIEGFLRNNTGYKIFNIYGNISIKKDNEIVASSYFTFFEADFGILKNKTSRQWTLKFTPEFVNMYDVDLSEYIVATDLQYNYQN